jgi:transposase
VGYQHRSHVGVTIAARHDGLPPQVIARAWNAQVRLCGRFHALADRKTQLANTIVVVPRGRGRPVPLAHGSSRRGLCG